MTVPPTRSASTRSNGLRSDFRHPSLSNLLLPPRSLKVTRDTALKLLKGFLHRPPRLLKNSLDGVQVLRGNPLPSSFLPATGQLPPAHPSGVPAFPAIFRHSRRSRRLVRLGRTPSEMKSAFCLTCAMCYSRRVARKERACGVERSGWRSECCCGRPLDGPLAPPTSPCLGAGLTVGSLPGCWFLGAVDASCAQTCAAQGLAYDDKTRTVAGSDASDGTACQTIASALDSPSGFQSRGVCAFALGCYIDTDNSDLASWCASPTTTATATQSVDERICACMTAGVSAPALSAGSLAVTALLLGGSGILIIRRRVRQ